MAMKCKGTTYTNNTSRTHSADTWKGKTKLCMKSQGLNFLLGSQIKLKRNAEWYGVDINDIYYATDVCFFNYL